MNSGYRLSYSTQDKNGGQHVPQKYMTCKQNYETLDTKTEVLIHTVTVPQGLSHPLL